MKHNVTISGQISLELLEKIEEKFPELKDASPTTLINEVFAAALNSKEPIETSKKKKEVEKVDPDEEVESEEEEAEEVEEKQDEEDEFGD